MHTPFPWRMGLLILVASCLMVRRGHTGAGAPATVPLVFAGAGTTLPCPRLLAEALRQRHPASTSAVPAGSGSTGDIRAAAEGARALGWLSRPLKNHEQNFGLTSVPYARTAVIIGTHPTVSDDEITCADLLALSKGTNTRWPDGRERTVLTPDNVRNGRAPLVKTVRVVCVPHTLAPGTQALLDVVRSPEAVHLLAAHGSLPGD